MIQSGRHDLAAWVTWFARDLDLRMPMNVIGCSQRDKDDESEACDASRDHV
jgi:hypothetical protein